MLLGDPVLCRRRAVWADRLEVKLKEVLQESEVISSSFGSAFVEQTMASYLAGDGGPEVWMDSFISEFKISLAEQLDEEEHSSMAVKMLCSHDLEPSQACQALLRLSKKTVDPASRSRYRQAMAMVYYRDNQLEEAAEVLRAELADPEASKTSKDMASVKLDAIQSIEPPTCWEERIMPPEMRESGRGLEVFNQMIEEGFEGRHGLSAASWLSSSLQEDGRYRQAAEVMQKAIDSQMKDRDEEHAMHLRVRAFEEAGWPDRAFDHMSLSSSFRPKFVERYGLPDEMLFESLKDLRDHGSASDFSKNQTQYLERLIHEGHPERALAEAMQPHSQDMLRPSEREAFTLARILLSSSAGADEKTEKQMAERLTELFEQHKLEWPSQDTSQARDELGRAAELADSSVEIAAQDQWDFRVRAMKTVFAAVEWHGS